MEWSVLDIGAYMTMVHTMLASSFYGVCSDPCHGGYPGLSKPWSWFI